MCRCQLKCRRQLRVSGVAFYVDWSAQFIVDIIQLVIVTTISMLVFVAFRVRCRLYLRCLYVTIRDD